MVGGLVSLADGQQILAYRAYLLTGPQEGQGGEGTTRLYMEIEANASSRP